MKIFKTILCVLFGLMFITTGLDNFLHFLPTPPMSPEELKIWEAMAGLIWLLPLITTIQIIGGLLFVLPKTRALGAIIMLTMTVPVILHNAVFMPEGLAITGPLFLINLWIIVDYWPKYKPMLG